MNPLFTQDMDFSLLPNPPTNPAPAAGNPSLELSARSCSPVTRQSVTLSTKTDHSTPIVYDVCTRNENLRALLQVHTSDSITEVDLYGQKFEANDCELPSSITNLHSKGELCDCTLVAKLPSEHHQRSSNAHDPKLPSRVRVHKLVLATRSEYFSALFRRREPSEVTESGDEQVLLESVTPEILAVLVNYFYHSDPGLSHQNVFDVLQVSDMLLIGGLTQRCFEYLSRHCADGNALALMREAQSRGWIGLQARAMLFFLENIQTIASDPASDLYKMGEDELLAILTNDRLRVDSEIMVLEVIEKWMEICSPKIRRVTSSGRQKDYCCRKLLFRSVRFGLISRKCFCDDAKNLNHVSSDENYHLTSSLDEDTQKYSFKRDPIICSRHLPNFEGIPNIHRHMSTCNKCKEIHGWLCDSLSSLDWLPRLDDDPQELRSLWNKPREPYELMITLGGWSGQSPISDVEVYDSESNDWLHVRWPRLPRAYHALVEMSHTVYVIGGYDGAERLNTMHRLDLESDAWVECAPMHERRCYVCVASLEGKIYAIGGHDGLRRLKSAEVYESATNQWTRVADMNQVRSDGCVVEHGGELLMIGGFDGDAIHNSVEAYSPISDTWNYYPPMNLPRSGVKAVVYRGTVCVVGGFDGTQRLRSMEKYDTEGNFWSLQTSEMNAARSNFGIALTSRYLVVVGGYDDERRQTTPECELYCWEEDLWLPIQTLPLLQGVSALSAATVSSPRLLRHIRESRVDSEASWRDATMAAVFTTPEPNPGLQQPVRRELGG